MSIAPWVSSGREKAMLAAVIISCMAMATSREPAPAVLGRERDAGPASLHVAGVGPGEAVGHGDGPVLAPPAVPCRRAG